MMHFVRTFSIMLAEGVRLIANEEVGNYGKIVYIKNFFQNAWWRKHIPHPTPLDPPLAINYKNHQKSLAYFSYWASLVLFFFTKRRSQKGGGSMAQCPPLNALLPILLRYAKYIALSIQFPLAAFATMNIPMLYVNMTHT